MVGSMRGAVLIAAVSMSGCWVACGDDGPGGANDPDGSAGTGGKSSGGNPAATGGRQSGGSASGGAQSGSGGSSGGASSGGASTGGMPVIGACEGGTCEGGPSDSGTDPPDATDTDGGDGAAGAGPLCPMSSSWPGGTYALEANVGWARSDVSVPDPNGTYNAQCSLKRTSQTLTITVPPPPYACVGVALDLSVQPIGDVYFCGNVSELPTAIHLDADCLGIPPCAGLDIDRRTGAVTNFFYDTYRLAPFGVETRLAVTGTGWPNCAATAASPPTSLPDPPLLPSPLCTPPPTNPQMGCSYSTEFAYPPDAPPACPGVGPDCTCTSTTEGYLETCCAP